MRILLVFLIVLAGCDKPSSKRIYRSINGLSYRVEEYKGNGAIAPSSTAVFAVLETANGSSEKLVLSGTYVGIQSILWEKPEEGKICLAGGYTETYRRIVALSVGAETRGVYTHLSDACPQ